MANTRYNNAKLDAVWAQNGITDIPDVPIVGMTYRNANITSSEIQDGQKYTEKFDSANYNQILFLLTSLTRTLCECGIMPFLRGQFYNKGAVCIYTDAQLYQTTRSISATETPYPTPADDSGVWVRIMPDVFTGATSTTDGVMGFVPAPKAGDEAKYLKGDGTFGVIENPFPAGIIMGWTGNTAPAGWLWCNGAAVSRETYSNLFSVVGISYGAGDGSTTFNLPDFRNRVMEGGNDMGDLKYYEAGLPSYVHSHSANTSSAGLHTHTITTSAAGNHSHTRGTMNITGRFSADQMTAFNNKNWKTEGAFWANNTDSWFAGTSKSADRSVVFGFDASRNWTGSTSTAGNHNHSATIAANGAHTHGITVNNNTESATSLYGKSNTVQMDACTASYIIKY